MLKINYYWIIAGSLNLFTFFLHLIGGQIELVDPMIVSSMELNQTSQLIGAWHMVTIILLVTSFILLAAGVGKIYNRNMELIRLVGWLNIAFCLPSLVTGLYYGILVPQWILFLPMGVLTFLGIRRASVK